MYYRLHRDPGIRGKGLVLARIRAQEPDDSLPWRAGQRFDAGPTQPVRCLLDPRGGPVFPDAFLSERIPLFSVKLIDCLRATGVDNLQLFDAEIVGGDGKAPDMAYKATNIVGLVSAMVEADSRFDAASQAPMLEFEHLAVANDRVAELRMFRLAENPSFIIVSEPVRLALDAADLIGVRAISLDDPSAY